jgi:hypothetical protein
MFVIVSCKKNTVPTSPVKQEYKFNEEDKNKIALIEEVAELLEKVYENDSACREVNEAILKRAYADERILLKDLIESDMGVFKRVFYEAAGDGNFPLVEKILLRPRPKAVVERGVVESGAKLPERDANNTAIAIYFPYSEDFTSFEKPTIVAADRDADEGPGREPYQCASSKRMLCYRNVIVNDNYAASKATHIVTIGAARVIPASPVPPSSVVARVYHGWSKLSKQMDKLISFTGNGGGSEIKVCRVKGYLKRKNEQIEDFDGDVVTLNYSRRDIRKKTWKRVYSVWDPEWNYQDAEQIYAVYEEDTKGEKTFSGSLTTTLSVPGSPSPGKATGEIGFEIAVSTQDEIITQRKIGRAAFFKLSKIDQGFGFQPDDSDFLSGDANWPIYDGGAVWSYTMPYQTD